MKLFLISVLISMVAAESCPLVAERAMYVNSWSSIYQNTANLTALGKYVQNLQITSLIIYGLPSSQTAYNNAINTLRGYGVKKFGAAYSSTSGIDTVRAFALAYPGQLTFVVSEIEPWVSSSGVSWTGASGSFAANVSYAYTKLKPLNFSLQAYLGWFVQADSDLFLPYLDQINLHAYVADASTSFSYSQSRLNYLLQSMRANTALGASSCPRLSISVIFSAETAADDAGTPFMGDYLNANGALVAEGKYLSGYNTWATGKAITSEMSYRGATYFTYSKMTGHCVGLLANCANPLVTNSSTSSTTTKVPTMAPTKSSPNTTTTTTSTDKTTTKSARPLMNNTKVGIDGNDNLTGEAGADDGTFPRWIIGVIVGVGLCLLLAIISGLLLLRKRRSNANQKHLRVGSRRQSAHASQRASVRMSMRQPRRSYAPAHSAPAHYVSMGAPSAPTVRVSDATSVPTRTMYSPIPYNTHTFVSSQHPAHNY